MLTNALMQVSVDIKRKCRRHHSFCFQDRASQKKSLNNFLQNEATLPWGEMHDKVNLHLSDMVELAIVFTLGFIPGAHIN